jgi:hypothetical protein
MKLLILSDGPGGPVATLRQREPGHKVTILEARPEPGGRIRTLREPFAEGLYAEAGAGRKPDTHQLTLAYVKKNPTRARSLGHWTPGCAPRMKSAKSDKIGGWFPGERGPGKIFRAARDWKELLTLKPCFVAIVLGLTAVLALAACQTRTERVESVSLDFPYGESRLVIRREGSTRLFYAELPESLLVREGAFDIDRLMDDLRPRLQDVVTGDRVAGRPFGTVSLTFEDGSARDYFLYDSAFAEGLFVTACRNISMGEENSPQLFEMVCGKRIGE